jgi:hypothetical protein
MMVTAVVVVMRTWSRGVVLAAVMRACRVGHEVPENRGRRRRVVVVTMVVRARSMVVVWNWSRRMADAAMVGSHCRCCHYRAVVMVTARIMSMVTVVRCGRRNQKQCHHHSQWQSHDIHGDRLLITGLMVS